ncbi:hypothetical protein L3073_17350 [Ancylomarina sp. DW003]|nr:hypothetical protein [Ancylomarina sp. DW003]MDE5423984.1 hypothetical protein [Ancylomarina sp. DW003]
MNKFLLFLFFISITTFCHAQDDNMSNEDNFLSDGSDNGGPGSSFNLNPDKSIGYFNHNDGSVSFSISFKANQLITFKAYVKRGMGVRKKINKKQAYVSGKQLQGYIEVKCTPSLGSPYYETIFFSADLNTGIFSVK